MNNLNSNVAVSDNNNDRAIFGCGDRYVMLQKVMRFLESFVALRAEQAAAQGSVGPAMESWDIEEAMYGICGLLEIETPWALDEEYFPKGEERSVQVYEACLDRGLRGLGFHGLLVFNKS